MNDGPINGLLGRDDGFDTGRMGCREGLLPSPAILPNTLYRLDASDLAESAGDGGDKSGNSMSAMDDLQ